MKLHPDVTDGRTIRRFKTLEKDFRKVHGDKYDYSESVFIKTKSKLQIRCPEHGYFLAPPNDHVRGQGCKECNLDTRRLGYKELIQRFDEIHTGKYRYSHFTHRNIKDKILIQCTTHGEFEQSIDIHLQGSGCYQCAKDNNFYQEAKSTERFIKDAISIHGDYYDYSKTIYVNNRIEVEIICPKHGVFKQAPKRHLRESGCNLCGREKVTELQRMSTENVIKRFKLVHGNRYDYSNVKSVSVHNPVEIVCSIHGVFKQSPTTHYNGANCPLCATGEVAQKSLKTTKQFVKEAKEIHGEAFDYSKVEYKGQLKNVRIICKTHGEFLIKPKQHLRGVGHPASYTSGFKYEEPAILYYLKVKGGAYKIGITNRTVKERFESDFHLVEVLKEWEFDKGRDAFDMEKRILSEFKDAKWKGADLLDSGNTELFEYDILQLNDD